MTEKPYTYVLRDMSGVAELEARADRVFADTHPEWHDEYPGLYDHVDSVAKSLFGIDGYDVGESDAKGMLYADGEQWDPVIDLLEEAGWDLTDGNGNLLHCADWFLPMIVLATERKMGHLPEPGAGRTLSDDESARLAEKVQEWASAWQKERRGK